MNKKHVCNDDMVIIEQNGQVICFTHKKEVESNNSRVRNISEVLREANKNERK